LLNAERAPWIHNHNIVAVAPDGSVITRLAGESDGIVAFASAHLPDVDSEIIVESDHVNVHRHPRTVLEVQRVLLEHLVAARAAAMHAHPRPLISRLPPVLEDRGVR
jgi:hypothetical protein